MAIADYIEDGKKLWKVRVNLRSPTVEGLRVEKKKSGITSEAAANRINRQFERECERLLMEKEAKGLSWECLIEDWEVAAKNDDVFIRTLALGTIEDYVAVVKKFTSDWFKSPAKEIDRAMAWRVLESVEREYTISRRKRLRTAIDAIFSWGMLSGRIKDIPSLPTEGYKTKMSQEDKMPEILNLTEIKTLIGAAKEMDHLWYPIWSMALLTGMRNGELFALRWSKIDLDSKLIYVHQNWTSKDGLGPTKGRYWRTVPISGELEIFLKTLRQKGKNSQEVWAWADNKKIEKKRLQIDDFVLPRFQCWKDGRQAEILRAFCSGIGVQSVKFHTLRACFATQLIKDGIAPAVIMKICGWKDLKTMQRYIRLAGIEVKGATEGLKIMPTDQVMGRVIELFSHNNN